MFKGTDLLHGITREEEERFDQREYIEIQQGDRRIEHPLSLSPTPTHTHTRLVAVVVVMMEGVNKGPNRTSILVAFPANGAATGAFFPCSWFRA